MFLGVRIARAGPRGAGADDEPRAAIPDLARALLPGRWTRLPRYPSGSGSQCHGGSGGGLWAIGTPRPASAHSPLTGFCAA